MASRLCVTLVVALLGGPGRAVADDAEDRAAVFVKKAGGYVVRDERQTGKPVVTVGLHAGKLTDDDLKRLAAFRAVKELDLSDTAITVAGLAHLAGLKTLT